MISEILLNPSFCLPVLLAVGCLVYSYVTGKSQLPDIPWIGYQQGQWFARTRCRWHTTTHFKEVIQYAYENYSKKGLSCIIPNISGDLILLPPTSTGWLISQPDDALSVKEAQMESLQTDYTFKNPTIVRQAYHEDIVKTDLTRQLGNLTADIMEELATGFDETWGYDAANWTEIGVFHNMMHIIARTSNRIFVGLPLCRNKDYLHYAICFAQDIPLSSNLIKLVPKTFHPILAPLITFPNWFHVRKLEKYLFPEIKRRLSALHSRFKASDNKAREVEPNDFLQWSINYAQTKLAHLPEEISPRTIAGRLMAVNFAAIHTSTFSITNTIFDLVSSDPSFHCIDQLREEAASVLAEENGSWTKHGLSKMHKVDSALRESQRIGSFIPISLFRKVIVRDGITTPDGTHCPYGSYVCIPALGVHSDNENYPDSLKYDPFRFMRERGAIEADKHGIIQKANCAFVSTSAEYQPFGHGRHACPGRFFAANELKLLLAYMVLNYDIEMLEKRPENSWVGPNCLPPMKATIKIRRRKTPVGNS